MNEHEIFFNAIEIDDLKERAAYLDDACSGNPELRQQIDRLLEAHEHTGEFLDVPVLQQLGGQTGLDASGDTCIDQSSASGEIDLSFLLPSSQPDSIGRLLHYEIRQVIGHGGCGIVLKAFDEKLERTVAIKVMAPELAATSPARKRFLREARATAAIRHENVVSIYAVEEQPLPFLVMEYIAGETLQQRLDRTGPLELREILKIGQQVASGLAAAHARGLIHRDIKPGNILLEEGTDHLKITDFGLARTADDASVTQSGVIAGTPLYMSPEQAQALEIDPRSDLFSLGSVLYVMCSGRPPFRAATSIAVLRRVVEDQPRPIQQIIPEIPVWLVEIISRLHAKHPEDRFHSAQEVSALLASCLSELNQQEEHVELPADILAQIPRTELEPGDQKSGEASADETVSLQTAVTDPARSIRQNWTVAVMVVLVLMVGLGITEATGVSHVSRTFIHFFSPEGTLIVEVDDPGVSVTLDGEELVITGTGAKEIRLQPGQYRLQANKGDKVVSQELITITTNDRKLVRISRAGIEKPVQPAETSAQRTFLPKPASWLASLRRDQISPAALAYVGNGDPERAPQSLVGVLGNPEPIHTTSVFSLAYSPDGKYLASASADQTILLRVAETGRVIRALRGHTAPVNYVAFLPDSKTLVSGSTEGTVNLWSVDEERTPTTINLKIQQMRMAVSPDGRFLAAGGSDGKVKLWKWSQWDQPIELTALHDTFLGAITFSSDGNLLACGWGGWKPESPIAVYQTADGTLKQSLPGNKVCVTSLAFSPDSKLLVSTGRDDFQKLWNLTTGEATKLEHAGLYYVCFSPDGSKIAMIGHFGVMIYDLETRSYLKGLESLNYRTFRGRYSLVFSPDGQTLAIGDSWGALHLFDTDTWQLKQSSLTGGHHSAIMQLAVSSDGETLFTKGLDKSLRRWDLSDSGKPEIIQIFQRPGNMLSCSAHGATCVAGDYPTVTWDVPSGRKMAELPDYLVKLLCSPDGKSVATITRGDNMIKLWNAQSGQEVHRFLLPDQSWYYPVFSDDSRLLAAVSRGGQALIWDVNTGEKLAAWKAGSGACATFDPSGKQLVIGQHDGNIVFWDRTSQTEIRRFSAHTTPVEKLKFTPDGRILLSSAFEGVIQLRHPEHPRPFQMIRVGLEVPEPDWGAFAPVVFDLDPSGQYLFASGATPVVEIHRLPQDSAP
ncbi:Serine/threonine-protein kinase PrkC [Gimesia panareensis]|uniref:non-specific serine/threonine protein kinase n=1 Tax=Gimesia panareensis TaxID=2527978 RepID=A0A518FUR5_9PLAN|nr:protein kinase [Gimesia panareensis]QDV20025.1 Serine/threonine-protein kinase PrkC [Gimesia panareensis]